MKKIKNLSEASFLKLFFAFIAAAFLIAAVCMPDRATMFSGLWKILTGTAKISTNYFSVGGYGAAFLNTGLVALICLGLFIVFRGKPNGTSTLAFLLTVGFGTWGINPINILPTVLGVLLYALVKKEKPGDLVNTMLFSTGIAPLFSELLFRYPGTQYIGFNWPGLILALVVGLAVGFFLPAGLKHSPKVHKGFDLYSAAVPVGMMAFFLNATLFKTMGLDVDALSASGDLTVTSRLVANIFCGSVFGLCVIFALLLGCKPRDYWQLLKNKEAPVSFSTAYGNAAFLMNVGVFGLFILAAYNLIGAPFTGVTFGVMFCMLACCNSGSHPLNVLPLVLGYAVSSALCGWLSPLLGGTFACAINTQAVCVGMAYANGLSPIVDKYGWRWGFAASVIHYLLVTSMPKLHGGFCLYNGGLTAAITCLIFVPILEHHFRTTAERKLKIKK
ncbi:MAG: DUF1576 domain-containing protein [Oscillospiraceae bacterium]|nr:DUF1576 domain-containing protein [Oscillospiraceae bacterium]